MIGQTISQYKILDKLGEGGMGVVYKAEDTKLKRIVALKFLPQRLSSGEQDKERFLQEAQSASALNHPNVCTIYDIQEFDGQTFIVMEFVDGKNLREAKSGISVKQVVDIVVQVAEGLAAAHEKGIIHRDIKSDNIMLRSDGRAQIMDFGLAKLQGPSALTKAGSTIGTTAYMSPGQLQGEEADHRTDIFALGVVMYELFSGQLPFKGVHEAAVMYEIVNVDPPSVRAAKPEIESDLERIVMKCLEKDRENRYQSAREVAVDLKRFKRDTEGKRLQSSAHELPAQPVQKRKSGVTIAVASTLALIVVASVAWFFLRGQGEALDSLAVLPFENAGGDQNMEYLSDGIAETLIFKLSQLRTLKVRSLSSVARYRGNLPDLRKVGHDLNVRAVLTGRVAVRRDKLAIVVELVDTKDNSTIWGDTYNRSLADVVTVQDEISSDVLTRLRFELTDEARKVVAKRYTDNAEAYQLYLKGRYFAQKRNEADLNKAIEYYLKALDIAPRYAVAYAGISEVYFLLSTYGFASRVECMPKAKEAAQKALAIDDALSEAHVSLAVIYDSYTWDFPAAERELKRAIELDPNNANAHHHYGYFLGSFGRHEEAIREARIALELEPLSPVMSRGLGWVFFFARQYEQALKYFKDCLETDPKSLSATFHLVFVYDKLGFRDSSMAMLKKYLDLIGEDTLATLVSKSYKRSGYRFTLMQLLEARPVGFLRDQGARAWLFAVVGEKERSLESLQKAYDERSAFVTFVNVHPSMDPVRSDKRFISLMQKFPAQK